MTIPTEKGAAATSGRGSAKDGRATKKGKGAEQGAKGKVQKTSKKSTKDKRSVQPAATLSLPVARIRRIMKDSDDIHSIGPDAVHVIGKAVVCVLKFIMRLLFLFLQILG